MTTDPHLRQQLSRLAREIASLRSDVFDIQRASQAAYRTVEGGTQHVYDTNGVLRQVIGEQDDGTYTVRDYNGDVPYTPTAPVLESQPGLLQITWDGLNTEGYVWGSDFYHVEVHASTSPSFTPVDATEMTVFSSTKGGVAALVLDHNSTWYIKFVAVSTSGTESASSAETSGTPQPPVTANGVTTYYTDEPPVGASEGDLWVDTNDGNHLYIYNSSSWVSIQDQGIVQASIDASTAISAAATAQATADGKINTFYQATPPGTPAGTPIGGSLTPPFASGGGIDEVVVGDLWYDTDDHLAYRYDGTSWVPIQDLAIVTALNAAQNAQTTADGKIQAFFQTYAPVGASTGDIWYDTRNGNKPHYFISGIWISIQDGDIAEASADAAAAISAAATAQSTADGKIQTFYQTIAPTSGMDEGDLWFDTDDNQAFIYTSGVWTSVQDQAIVQALSDAQNAQTTADGKITAFYQDSAPSSGMSTGDLWFDTDNGNKVYYYDGAQWVALEFGEPAIAVVAPGTSPTPLITSGVKSLFIRWEPVSNGSSFDVEVHISTTQGFTATLGNSATLAATTQGTGTTIRSLPPDFDTPLSQGTTYYVKLIAKNTAGSAAVSSEASGSLVPIDTDDISVGAAWIGTMNVDRLTGGQLDAETVIGTGAIRAEGAGGEVVQMAADGFLVRGTAPVGEPEGPVLVYFPTNGDPNLIAGTLIASTISVTSDESTGEGATFRGTTKFETGASVKLLNSVSAPTAAPTLTDYWPWNQASSLPKPKGNTIYPRGMTVAKRFTTDAAGTEYIYMCIGSSVAGSADSRIVRLPRLTSGAVLETINPDSGNDFTALDLCKLGDRWYVLCSDWYGTEPIRVYDENWTYLGYKNITASDRGLHPSGICTDGAAIYVTTVGSSGNLKLLKYNSITPTMLLGQYQSADAVYTSTYGFDLNDSLIVTTNLSFGAEIGNFDLGGQRLIVGHMGQNKMRSFTIGASTLTEQTNEEFKAADGNVSGLAYNPVDAEFITTSVSSTTSTAVNVYKYDGPMWTTESSTWWASYSWADSVNITCTTNTSSTTLTRTSGTYVSTDVGVELSGTFIPSNTKITAVLNSTQVTMSNAATGSGTNSIVHKHETRESPRYSMTKARRAWWNFTGSKGLVPEIKIYLGRGSTEPAAANRYRQAAGLNNYGTTTSSDAAVFTNTYGVAPTASTFGSDAAANLFSEWTDDEPIDSFSLTNASTTITNSSPRIRQEFVGAKISGAGIPAGTTLVSAAANGLSGTMSQAATSTQGSITVTFTRPSVDIRGSGFIRAADLLATRAQFTSLEDVTASPGNKPPLIIGNPLGNHMRVDGNEIQAMSLDASTGNLLLNAGGGNVRVYSPTGSNINSNMHARGTGAFTSNGSGAITITHNLGSTGYQAYAQVASHYSSPVVAIIENKNANNMTVRLYNVSNGTDLTNSTRTIEWMTWG